MIPEQTAESGFTEFVGENERRLRQALTASLGNELGRDAAAEALAYGWEHWEKVRSMDNPVGYLYVLGRNRARTGWRARSHHFALPPEDRTPWVEPALPKAIARLPERERTVVVLIHGYGWTMRSVAETLGISKSTVQTHAERGMKALRRRMGVPE